MIKRIKQLIETQTSLLRKKAGVFKEEDIECAIDEEIVDCEEIDEEPYVGVPAPIVLEQDPWFGPVVLSEKGQDYMERETEIKRQEQMKENDFFVEPENIHDLMYELATKAQSTTLYIDPPGGSENFQESGWQSGTGWRQYQ